jgi:hypothetical protein
MPARRYRLQAIVNLLAAKDHREEAKPVGRTPDIMAILTGPQSNVTAYSEEELRTASGQNPKSRNPKAQNPKQETDTQRLVVLNFEFGICFGFRAADFGFSGQTRRPATDFT